MSENNELPTECNEGDAGTDEAIAKRRALMLKLAAGVFGAPVILAGLTRKAAALS